MEPVDRLVMLGKKQLEDEDYNEALHSFEQAILLNQKDPDLWNLKGIALRSLVVMTKQLNALTNHWKLILVIGMHHDKITKILELPFQNNIR